MSIPSTMKTIVVAEGGKTELVDRPVPDLKNNEVLVKVHAVSQNPTDWKHAKFISKPGDVAGCDFAGEVVKLSPSGDNNGLKVGDRISGMVHGGKFQDKGSLAEYLKVEADLSWKIPDNVSYEQASTLNIALQTPVQGFYGRWGFSRPSSPSKSAPAVLIWSGATAVGFNAIQLAHLGGHKVVTTASPNNHDLLRSIGADDVFDYRDPDVVEKIKKAYPDLEYAYDCISEGDSTVNCAKALGPKGGKIITLLPPSKEAKEIRPNEISIDNTLLYTALGYSFEFVPGVTLPEMPEDRALIVGWYAKDLPELLTKDQLKFASIDVLGGLDQVEKGFKYMADGKVKAKKLVYVL